jgi:catechol 2,3-dioxygenase
MEIPSSLPERTHVGAVHLQISDLERSLDYYQHVLGLQILGRGAGAAALGAGDRALVHLREKRGAHPAPRGGLLGLYHFALLLPTREDLGAFLSHLGSVGIRAGMADHLVSEALYLRDPDGLGIEVYADRPRDQWRYDGGELVMATDPLDAQGLVSAATRPWQQTPDITTMGHVHLHVGNLAEASRFYHHAIGLDVMVRSYPGALFVSAGGYHHHLGLNTWAAGAPSASENDARLLEWELRIPDGAAIETLMDRTRTLGYQGDWGADAPLVRDPWGTALRLFPEV